MQLNADKNRRILINLHYLYSVYRHLVTFSPDSCWLYGWRLLTLCTRFNNIKINQMDRKSVCFFILVAHTFYLVQRCSNLVAAECLCTLLTWYMCKNISMQRLKVIYNNTLRMFAILKSARAPNSFWLQYVAPGCPTICNETGHVVKKYDMHK